MPNESATFPDKVNKDGGPDLDLYARRFFEALLF